MRRNTWNGALSLHLSGVAEANHAVRMGKSQKSLTEVIHPLIQLIWNVGCLEYQQTNTENTHRSESVKALLLNTWGKVPLTLSNSG